eukprot:1158943-Pelagomonas_calceolata.AAC.10
MHSQSTKANPVGKDASYNNASRNRPKKCIKKETKKSVKEGTKYCIKKETNNLYSLACMATDVRTQQLQVLTFSRIPNLRQPSYI